MKIGIDISQIVYGTGVSNYLQTLVEEMIKMDAKNEYILFFSSMRKNFQFSNFLSTLSSRPKGNFQSKPNNLSIKKFKIPPTLLDLLWNRLHILPIERWIGDVDVFITSDWTEPPAKRARKATIIYDLIVYKYPKETDSKIVKTQKRKLSWVKKESSLIFCISESTKKDVVEILGIAPEKLRVLYPGFSIN